MEKRVLPLWGRSGRPRDRHAEMDAGKKVRGEDLKRPLGLP